MRGFFLRSAQKKHVLFCLTLTGLVLCPQGPGFAHNSDAAHIAYQKAITQKRELTRGLGDPVTELEHLHRFKNFSWDGYVPHTRYEHRWHVDEGVLYAELGQFKKAEAILHWTEYLPQETHALYLQGRLAAFQNRLQEAQYLLRLELAQHPTYRPAQGLLSDITRSLQQAMPSRCTSPFPALIHLSNSELKRCLSQISPHSPQINMLIQALGGQGNPADMTALTPYLAQPEHRTAALSALGKFMTPEQALGLAPYLTDMRGIDALEAVLTRLTTHVSPQTAERVSAMLYQALASGRFERENLMNIVPLFGTINTPKTQSYLNQLRTFANELERYKPSAHNFLKPPNYTTDFYVRNKAVGTARFILRALDRVENTLRARLYDPKVSKANPLVLAIDAHDPYHGRLYIEKYHLARLNETQRQKWLNVLIEQEAWPYLLKTLNLMPEWVNFKVHHQSLLMHAFLAKKLSYCEYFIELGGTFADSDVWKTSRGYTLAYEGKEVYEFLMWEHSLRPHVLSDNEELESSPHLKDLLKAYPQVLPKSRTNESWAHLLTFPSVQMDEELVKLGLSQLTPEEAYPALVSAVQHGDMIQVDYFLKQGMRLDMPPPDNDPGLLYHALNSSVVFPHFVQELIQKGVPMHSEHGTFTLLELALLRADKDLVQQLLAQGDSLKESKIGPKYGLSQAARWCTPELYRTLYQGAISQEKSSVFATESLELEHSKNWATLDTVLTLAEIENPDDALRQKLKLKFAIMHGVPETLFQRLLAFSNINKAQTRQLLDEIRALDALDRVSLQTIIHHLNNHLESDI